VRANITREDAPPLWVLEGEPVSMTGFNAEALDVVQVGGVWTPPPLRGRGYGRAVVAGSLLDRFAHGARRSVLFTDAENQGALRAYAVLSYRHIGEYGLWLFS
jgi:predicted GNAT family acetyltransferase